MSIVSLIALLDRVHRDAVMEHHKLTIEQLETMEKKPNSCLSVDHLFYHFADASEVIFLCSLFFCSTYTILSLPVCNMEGVEFVNEIDVWEKNKLPHLTHNETLHNKRWRTEENCQSAADMEDDGPNGALERLNSLTKQRMAILVEEVKKGVGRGVKGLRYGLFAPTRMQRFLDLGLLDDRTFFGMFNVDLKNKGDCYFAKKELKCYKSLVGIRD
eukprot:m.56972 g.56972  ORF g.56972 m.56972 type:complete len:215 (-) comp11070_c0_seq2:767-1411(-)